MFIEFSTAFRWQMSYTKLSKIDIQPTTYSQGPFLRTEVPIDYAIINILMNNSFLQWIEWQTINSPQNYTFLMMMMNIHSLMIVAHLA